MEQFDHLEDVVVVGSGAGGMAAAWTAAKHGLGTLVIEKCPVFGGNSALSGGGAWLPNAPYFLRRGERDDPEKLLAYLRTIAPGVAPERQRRYLEEAPKLAEAFESTPYFHDGAGFVWIKGYSDYHPEKGGNPLGRGLWSGPIDQRLLGTEADNRRGARGRRRLPGAPKGMWLTSADFHDLIALKWGTWRGPRMLLVLAWRTIVSSITRHQIVTGGAALVTRLRLLLRDAAVPVWLNTPMRTLITDTAGRVVGVVVEREGRPFRIGARRGVIMAAGGFEGNSELRKRYQPNVPPGLSSGSPDNTGDGILAGEALGAALDLMDDAWWMPAMQLPSGVSGMVAERAYPHQFIVNSVGSRFVNEASPYTDFGHAQIKGQESGVGHMPAYMIIDDHAWQHYFFGGLPGRRMPQEWLSSGVVQRADTMEGLARRIGVPTKNLVETAERFNRFARQGRDEDFHRGESAYDHWYGNPKYPNPNLGEVSKPPFFAFRMVLSDLGTKGGLLTDEYARVLRRDGSSIPGLYATGNNSASVMGNDYAGPGATLGPAMTFGWIAAQHIANESISSKRTAEIGEVA
jgi:3-oxosteroid 1-dehydrogenase